MNITYANAHSWIKTITDDLLQNYGSSDKKRIRKALESVTELGITHEIAPANEDFFSWFTPMYEKTIRSRNNPNPRDVYRTTVGKEDTKLTYKALTIKQHGEPVGGAIFSLRKSRISIAYRIFNSTWNQGNKIASPALYGEYLLDHYSQQCGFNTLVHGQDRNPYGVNSAIGLATFKLAVGCFPKLPPTYELQQLNVDDITYDILVLHSPDTGNLITEATLFTKKEYLEKYTQLLSYQERLLIHTTFR